MIIDHLLHQERRRRFQTAFTLVEILVVLFIMLILSAVALPTVRNLIADQKVGTATRNLASFIEMARNSAIATGRPTGIRIERAGFLDNLAGRAASIRVRQVNGVPAYTGESSDAHALLLNDPNWPPVGHPLRPNVGDPDPIPGLDTAVFNGNDNQLLLLSARMIFNNQPNPPIRIGDLIELPGGRVAPIAAIFENPASGPHPVSVTVHFDLTEKIISGPLFTARFPSSARRARVNYPNPFVGIGTIAGAERAKYRIHRRPVVSSTSPYSFPRGVVIDLNYSGVGVDGNQFAPVVDPGDPQGPALAANDITIIFGPDGKVVQINDASGVIGTPSGLIFLCIGGTDGVRPLNLLSTEDRATANILNLDSTWLVINPSTGRVVASPFAVGANPLPAAPVADPYELNAGPPVVRVLAPFIASARSLALLSDTLEAE